MNKDAGPISNPSRNPNETFKQRRFWAAGMVYREKIPPNRKPVQEPIFGLAHA
jgi:hypothetical protein